eukprot:gene502-1148_t
MSDRVTIFVRGVHYETFAKTLQYYPSTLLGELSTQQLQQHTASLENKIILDCSVRGFEAVLFYYQSRGILSCPPGLLFSHFVELCRYFKLPEQDIEIMKNREGCICSNNRPTVEFKSCYLEKLWKFFEQPLDGTFSLVYAILSYLLAVAAVVLACATSDKPLENTPNSSRLWLRHTELCISIVFCVEYTLRLIVAPIKKDYLTSVLNVIDLLSFLPFLFCAVANYSSYVIVLGLTRTIRVLKLLSLTRMSSTLRKAFQIISQCRSDIIMLTLSIAISALSCGSMVYLAEMNVPDTQFTSVSQSMWWAIQTIVPLGYGDIVPIGWLGKCCGSVVAVISSFAFTVPLLFVGGKFLILYIVNSEDSIDLAKLSSTQIYEFRRGIFRVQPNEAETEPKLPE